MRRAKNIGMYRVGKDFSLFPRPCPHLYCTDPLPPAAQAVMAILRNELLVMPLSPSQAPRNTIRSKSTRPNTRHASMAISAMPVI
jgi:hypothetical protein